MGRTGRRLAAAYRGLALFWLGVCGAFALANLAAEAVLRARDAGARERPAEFIERALAAAHPGLDEEARLALWRAGRLELVPELLAQPRESPLESRFVNVDPAGFRRGSAQGSWPPDAGAYNVFLFGGSTAFGYGVADEQTLSSHLQGLLGSVDGRPVRLYNFARGGFYSVQERLLFEKLLATGPHPDLAVFVDGLNDFIHHSVGTAVTRLTTRRAEADLAHPLLALWRELPVARLFARESRNLGPGVAELAAGPERGRPPPDRGALVDRVIERYLRNRAAIEAIAAVHDVGVAFVWQPVPTYEYDLSHHTYRGSFGPVELTRDGYPRMAERVAADPPGASFLWCADIQEGVEELLYVDQVHYAPRMSERVARCIAAGLRERGLLHAPPQS